MIWGFSIIFRNTHIPAALISFSDFLLIHTSVMSLESWAQAVQKIWGLRQMTRHVIAGHHGPTELQNCQQKAQFVDQRVKGWPSFVVIQAYPGHCRHGYRGDGIFGGIATSGACSSGFLEAHGNGIITKIQEAFVFWHPQNQYKLCWWR